MVRSITHIIIGSAENCAIRSNCHAGDRDILLGYQLMRTIVLSQIPDANTTAPVTADDLALIRVNHDIVDRAAVVVAALDGATARLPDLDSTILRARDHPFALAVERDARDVARVALEGQQGVGVGGLDVEELDGVVAGGREEALVGRDAQSVDLRVGVLDGTGADAGEGLPESVPNVAIATASACALRSKSGAGWFATGKSRAFARTVLYGRNQLCRELR